MPLPRWAMPKAARERSRALAAAGDDEKQDAPRAPVLPPAPIDDRGVIDGAPGWQCAVCTFFNADPADVDEFSLEVILCDACQHVRGAPPLGDGVDADQCAMLPKAVVCHSADGYVRNRHVLGTFDERATFQLSLRRYALDDPLRVRIFPGLGYHCLPQLGVYSDAYDQCAPLALIELPDDYMRAQLPPAAWAACESQARDAERGRAPPVEFFLSLHATPPMAKDDGGGAHRINLMTHMWTFAHAHFDAAVRVDDTIEVGVFSLVNARADAPVDVRIDERD